MCTKDYRAAHCGLFYVRANSRLVIAGTGTGSRCFAVVGECRIVVLTGGHSPCRLETIGQMQRVQLGSVDVCESVYTLVGMC